MQQESSYQDKIEFLKSTIKSIPDYPKKGVLFRDITSLCQNGKAFALSIDLLYDKIHDLGITKIVCAEARGFIFGAPLAARLKAGLVLVRKKGKLPRETIQENYELEYGFNTLEMNTDAITSGDKVLIIDDLIATGGTVEAMLKLVKRCQGEVVLAAFIINLPDLGGINHIKKQYDVNCFSLIDFEGH